MAGEGDAKLEKLSRFIVTAPPWKRSVGIIIVLCLSIDIMVWLRHGAEIAHMVPDLGIYCFLIPALLSFLLTTPLVRLFGGKLTWDWSALIALISVIVCIFIGLSPALIFNIELVVLVFAIALGFVVSVRLLLLLIVADYHITHILLPAFLQSAFALVFASYYFGSHFVLFAFLLQVFFAGGIAVLVWVLQKPLKELFHVDPLALANAFMQHLADGSNSLDDFFRRIGEAVYIPQMSLFIRRAGRDDAVFVVPNVHPGPLGEIGGSNFPKLLHDMIGKDTFVLHGCATHDFNPVSGSETEKLASAVKKAKEGAVFSQGASISQRFTYGTVNVMAQAFGDSLLLISTRSPEITDDLDYSVGLAIMEKCRQHFKNVGFVDAHNSFVDVPPPVMPATLTATEYMKAAVLAAEGMKNAKQGEFMVGTSHVKVPFTRAEGFGDLGIQVMVVRTDGQDTAYVLFDGNNIHRGVREELCALLVPGMVDECEIMTTDTHVVNTVSGKNPVGLKVTPDQIRPFLEEAVISAVSDLKEAESAGGTAECEGVIVFGSQRITQLASLATAVADFAFPAVVIVIVMAFLCTVMTYFVIT